MAMVRAFVVIGLRAGSTYGFGYNDRNRVAMVQQGGSTIAAYGYNALNQRVQKTVNGTATRFMYDEASQLIGEYGSQSREYIWMDDVPVAVIDISGGISTMNYIHVDGLNTPRAISNSQGQTIWQWAYANNAWGEQAPTSDGYVFNLRFPGQYFDVESGVNYNVNRDYDSATGRYRQSDPLGLVAGFSTYAYVNSNPAGYVDPLGLKKFPAVIVEGGGGMGIVGGSGGMIVVADPGNPGSIYTFGYGGGNVGLGILGSAYGGLQFAVIDANSMNDISGWGWYVSGGLASPTGGVSGTYSGAFWFQDASYSIKSIGGAVGAAANVGVGVSYTWAISSANVVIPQSVRDALAQSTRKMDMCE